MRPVRRAVPLAVVVAVVAIAAAAFASSGIARQAPGGQAAKRTSVTLRQHATMHLVKKKGNILRESGTTTGTLPGKVSGRFDVSDISNPTGTVTFKPYSGSGSITVTASGTPVKLGYPVSTFRGFLAVKGGSGRYDRVTGHGSFTGSVNRKTWSIVVNVPSLPITY